MEAFTPCGNCTKGQFAIFIYSPSKWQSGTLKKKTEINFIYTYKAGKDRRYKQRSKEVSEKLSIFTQHFRYTFLLMYLEKVCCS